MAEVLLSVTHNPGVFLRKTTAGHANRKIMLRNILDFDVFSVIG